MAWFSILPEQFSFLETWLTRLFILLGLLTIGPWLMLVLYDMLLYIFRAVVFELPYIGGRVTGQQRPRAPSLTERPGGQPRKFSINVPTSGDADVTDPEGLRNRASAAAAKLDGKAIIDD
ncbi:MAG: hypothetical protein M1817_000015 [Caeruleum heppii]|nr:MAG: hypothetical protein M1817_000015 [Caeruleum heppii]